MGGGSARIRGFLAVAGFSFIASSTAAGAERRTLVLFLSDNGGCAEVLGGNDAARLPGGNDTSMSDGIGWAKRVGVVPWESPRARAKKEGDAGAAGRS